MIFSEHYTFDACESLHRQKCRELPPLREYVYGICKRPVDYACSYYDLDDSDPPVNEGIALKPGEEKSSGNDDNLVSKQSCDSQPAGTADSPKSASVEKTTPKSNSSKSSSSEPDILGSDQGRKYSGLFFSTKLIMAFSICSTCVFIVMKLMKII